MNQNFIIAILMAWERWDLIVLNFLHLQDLILTSPEVMKERASTSEKSSPP